MTPHLETYLQLGFAFQLLNFTGEVIPNSLCHLEQQNQAVGSQKALVFLAAIVRLLAAPQSRSLYSLLTPPASNESGDYLFPEITVDIPRTDGWCDHYRYVDSLWDITLVLIPDHLGTGFPEWAMFITYDDGEYYSTDYLLHLGVHDSCDPLGSYIGGGVAFVT